MTASVTIQLYQPAQSLHQSISDTSNLTNQLTGWFSESWDNETEHAIFNANTQQLDEDGIIFSFEVSWLEDEKALFAAVRNLPAELTFTSVFYGQVGEFSRKWSVAGKNTSKKVFEESLNQFPTSTLRYALHEENTKLFKTALPPKWGSILMSGSSLLEYCWERRLNSFADLLLKRLDDQCGLDFTQPTLLSGAIKYGSAKLIPQFIQSGANPLFVDSEGNNALHLWAEFNPDETLLPSLIQHGVPINARNGQGLTPVLSLLINEMAEHDSLENLVNILQNSGADLSVTCPDGGSLLWYANSDELRTYLRAHGITLSRPLNAYVNDNDGRYDNPLDCAIFHDDEEMFIHYLQPKYIKNNDQLLLNAYASKRYHWFKLLLENGASPNGDNIFSYLLTAKEYDLIRLLIAHGVDVNGKPSDEQRYLDVLWAMNDEEDEAIQLFREAGCDPSAMLVCLAYSRMSADKAEILFKQLLSDGADVNRHYQQDWRLKFGEIMGHATPLYAATRRGNVTMVRLLLEHGANPHFSTQAMCTPLKYVDNLFQMPSLNTEENQAIRELLLAHGA